MRSSNSSCVHIICIRNSENCKYFIKYNRIIKQTTVSHYKNDITQHSYGETLENVFSNHYLHIHSENSTDSVQNSISAQSNLCISGDKLTTLPMIQNMVFKEHNFGIDRMICSLPVYDMTIGEVMIDIKKKRKLNSCTAHLTLDTFGEQSSAVRNYYHVLEHMLIQAFISYNFFWKIIFHFQRIHLLELSNSQTCIHFLQVEEGCL